MIEKKPTTMLIEANFDIDQVGQSLEWRFSRKDGHGNPLKGRYAGGIYFTVGELTRVRVRAGSYSQFNGFKVLDCTLITMPQVTQIGAGVRTEFAPVSPFVTTTKIAIPGASVSLPGSQFVPSAVHPDDPEYNEFALEWNSELTVGKATGRWEIAFVLTVEIQRADGTTEQRAFSFDPEGEVGSGVSPPKIQARDAFPGMTAMSTLMPEGEVGSGVSPPKKNQ
ncbi:hypothetical protein [Massilia sp. CF038]|uniref:hypothetical protein n=1 Tax=Massilia sp. CF038 TaxID=1881045 RepID=UPI0009164789|nr:hypothetical protein [Massilia sp. CF038]SHG97536.1 hypothetical protein SAMN05428948_2137 [Massilia sp. CF038]